MISMIGQQPLLSVIKQHQLSSVFGQQHLLYVIGQRQLFFCDRTIAAIICDLTTSAVICDWKTASIICLWTTAVGGCSLHYITLHYIFTCGGFLDLPSLCNHLKSFRGTPLLLFFLYCNNSIAQNYWWSVLNKTIIIIFFMSCRAKITIVVLHIEGNLV